KIKIDSNQPIILEGIHGLNPILTSSIPDEDKFKIYISALTQINLDDHNRIPTADLRMIRRIVRDYILEDIVADNTILQWASVRRGERRIYSRTKRRQMLYLTLLVYMNWQ
ncbi:AAA family ATPase, partial [Clostridioides difficile]